MVVEVAERAQVSQIVASSGRSQHCPPPYISTYDKKKILCISATDTRNFIFDSRILRPPEPRVYV